MTMPVSPGNRPTVVDEPVPSSARETRIKACELVAQVVAGMGKPDGLLMPWMWSLTVFFENYIDGGAEATLRDFGPKKPVKLKVRARGR